jgi:SsrA-binding protein
MATTAAAGTQKKQQDDHEKLIVKNRRATFDYTIDEVYEAGLALLGSEVKSLRLGKVDIVDAYASVDGRDMFLKQLNIAPFEMARAFPHEPRRARKLLLHRREIDRIQKALSRDGATVIPLRLYFKGGKVKVELGIAKGKKTYDKRHDIAKKTADKEAKASIVRGRKGERA